MSRDRRTPLGSSFWDEPTVRTMTAMQQYAYLLAKTQADLSRCGVVPYHPQVWARFSSDQSGRALHRHYQALRDSRHVALDEDYLELLVRTHVWHDRILAQPLMVAAMVNDFWKIRSTLIRRAFLGELWRIAGLVAVGHADEPVRKGLSLAIGAEVSDKVGVARAIGDGLAKPIAEGLAEGWLNPFPNPSPDPKANPSPSPSPDPPRKATGLGYSSRETKPPTPTPIPSPTSQPSNGSPRVRADQDFDSNVREFTPDYDPESAT